MQPSARGSKWPLACEQRAAEEWEQLRKGGKTGFVTILIMMVWWNEAVRTAKDRKDFDAVLEDIIWVLGEMIRTASGTAAEKRPLDGGEPEDGAPTSKRYVCPLPKYLILLTTDVVG